MTDGSESVVWDAVCNSFGDVNSMPGSATNNMRFPGQYFLLEDGLHYNWYRRHDPTLGRYIQPDPLGFVNGPSAYANARSSPLMKTDITGLISGPFGALSSVLSPLCLDGLSGSQERTSVGERCFNSAIGVY
jgi:RHS repeat-associated protein